MKSPEPFDTITEVRLGPLCESKALAKISLSADPGSVTRCRLERLYQGALLISVVNASGKYRFMKYLPTRLVRAIELSPPSHLVSTELEPFSEVPDWKQLVDKESRDALIEYLIANKVPLYIRVKSG